MATLNFCSTNIGNARLSDLEVDLGMKGLQFNVCLSAFEDYDNLADQSSVGTGGILHPVCSRFVNPLITTC